MRRNPERQIVPVLLYHYVTADRAGDPWALPASELAKQLDLLAETKTTTFTATDFARLASQNQLPPGPLAMVTFDDAQAGVVDYALPLLRERGLAATFFVTSDFVGRPGNISSTTLAQLPAPDFEIGAHSVTHPRLDEISRQRAWREIVDSRTAIEDCTGVPVTSFAYPHGYHGSAVREQVIQAGYVTAHAVKNAFHVGDDLFAIARLTVLADTTPEKVENWIVNRRGAPLARNWEAASTKLWRMYRKLREQARWNSQELHDPI